MITRCPIALCLVVFMGLLCVRTARADSALFASSEARTAELLPELTLALQGHGVLLLARGLGDSRTPLERAAAAQRIARNVAAGAAFWIEHEPPVRVRAVGLSGESIVEAPLPAPLETIEPRVFASVATSVLLEALGRTRGVDTAPPERSAAPTPGIEALPLTPVVGPVLPAVEPWPPRATSRHADALPLRFFLRAGLTSSLVYLHHGATPDRTPHAVLNDVATASRNAAGMVDLALLNQLLRARGYACKSAVNAQEQIMIQDCTVAVSPAGMHAVLAVDLAAGARITDRLAFSLTARVAPNAGMGTLAHTLLGVQLEGTLLVPRATGWWLVALFGLGVGRIQAQPASSGAVQGPYATSGPGNVRVGLLGGYRFTANVGLYVGPTLHVGFPAKLVALDPSLGLEARL